MTRENAWILIFPENASTLTAYWTLKIDPPYKFLLLKYMV